VKDLSVIRDICFIHLLLSLCLSNQNYRNLKKTFHIWLLGFNVQNPGSFNFEKIKLGFCRLNLFLVLVKTLECRPLNSVIQRH